jgi:hypothetical protein
MQRESRPPVAGARHAQRVPKTPLIGGFQVGSMTDAVANILLAVLSFLLIIVVACGVHGPVRYVPALIFALFVPGRVVVGYWSSLPAEARLPVTVAVSVALCTTLAALAVLLRISDVLVVFFLLSVPSTIVLSARARHFYAARRPNG